MAFRAFNDRNGHGWEVRNRAFREWQFYPLANNPNAARRVTSPGYEKDPFELSVEELQRLLDSAPAPSTRSTKSPFKD